MEQILKTFELKEAELKYEKAQKLLELITDKEFEEIITANPTTFANITNISTNQDKVDNLVYIEKAIELFIDCINNRGLTKDEYDAMTADDIIDYLRNIFNKDIINLYPIICHLEQYK